MSKTFRWEQEGQSYPLVTIVHNEDGTGNTNIYFEDGKAAQEIHGIPVEALRAFLRTVPENPPTIRCPYECGGKGVSQGGSSYYTCDTCEEHFDRDELDESGQFKDA